MRRILFVSLIFLLSPLLPAHANVSVSIGINMPTYPELVPVPGYPVYYDPAVEANYFFYDGLYWVFDGDSWYSSDWYDGPWELIEPDFVPVFVLRVPVQYYRRPPVYFRAWQRDAPPRWEQRWGNDWERRHNGWNHWDRRSAPRPAPLPIYQRDYSGNRYPHRVEEQRDIRVRNYRYEPHESASRRVQEQVQTRRSAERQEATRIDDRRQPLRPPQDRHADEQRNEDRRRDEEQRHAAEQRQQQYQQQRQRQDAERHDAPHDHGPPQHAQGGPPSDHGNPPQKEDRGRNRHDEKGDHGNGRDHERDDR